MSQLKDKQLPPVPQTVLNAAKGGTAKGRLATLKWVKAHKKSGDARKITSRLLKRARAGFVKRSRKSRSKSRR